MINLYNGDCLEVMKQISDKSIDLILTDPPYGTTACKWDSIIPFDKMWKQLNRVIKENGAIVLFGNQPFTSKLICSNIENFSHQWIWIKNNISNPMLSKKMPLRNYEDVCVFYQEYDLLDRRRKYFEKILKFINKSKINILKETNQGLDHCFRFDSEQFTIPTEENYNLLIEKYKINQMDNFIDYENLIMDRTYNPQNIKYVNPKIIKQYGKTSETIGKNDRKDYLKTNENYPKQTLYFDKVKNPIHPTQKPIDLLEYLIKTYTNENETILDFTMGSGSTGVASVNTYRDFIGIELDKNYFEIAQKRIEEAEKERSYSLFEVV